VTDQSSGAELVYGQGAGATDGLDSGCGENEAGPGALAAFRLPDGVTTVQKDFRNSLADEVEWHVRFDGPAFPVRVSWNAGTLPPGDFRLIDDGGGGLVDVTIEPGGPTSIDITDPSVTGLRLLRGRSDCATFTVGGGWNPISPMFIHRDSSLSALFPQATAALSYDARLTDFQNLDASKGYWIRFPSRQEVSLCGQPSGRASVPLNEGWNFVGVFEHDVAVADVTTDPPGILESPFLAYFSSFSGSGYAEQSTLNRVGAYWVKASQDGTLILPPPIPSSSTTIMEAGGTFPGDSAEHSGHLGAESSPFSLRMAQVTAAPTVDLALSFQQTAGGEALQTIRFGLDPCATEDVDECAGERGLPPYMPPDVFEVRFVDSTKTIDRAWPGGQYEDYRFGDVGSTGTEMHALQIQWGGEVSSTDVNWNLPAGAQGRLFDAGGTVDVAMSGAGSATLSDTSIVRYYLRMTYDEVQSPLNTPPVARTDSVVVRKNERAIIAPLSNDSDADGDPLQMLSIESESTQGGAVRFFSGDSLVLYQPPIDFVGQDAFHYEISDGAGGTATGTVAIDVRLPDLPTIKALPDSPLALEGGSFHARVLVGSDDVRVDGLYGVGFEIHYDPAVLSTTPDSISLGSAFADGQTVRLEPQVDVHNGVVAIGLSRERGSAGLDGVVSVVGIRFDLLPTSGTGTTALGVRNVLAVDSTGAEIRLDPVNTSILIIPPLRVWPGLVNRNLSVEAADVLSIGDCFGLSGPSRPGGADVSWEARDVLPWAFDEEDISCTLNSTEDPASVDTNGDGFIDQNDVEAVDVNYGLGLAPVAAKSSGAASIASLTLPPGSQGTRYQVAVRLDVPASGLFGAAAGLRVPVDSVGFVGAAGGALIDEGELLNFAKFLPESGFVDAASTRLRGSEGVEGPGEVLVVELEATRDLPDSFEITLESLIVSRQGVGPEPAAPGDAVLVEATSTAIEALDEIPADVTLLNAYPNPFQARSRIGYSIPEPLDVNLSVFDMLGRLVAVLTNEQHAPGRHDVAFDGNGLPSGVYVVRLEAGSTVLVRTMILTR
jgi:hypothetical protein